MGHTDHNGCHWDTLFGVQMEMLLSPAQATGQTSDNTTLREPLILQEVGFHSQAATHFHHGRKTVGITQGRSNNSMSASFNHDEH
jgi:hypothetical protein